MRFVFDRARVRSSFMKLEESIWYLGFMAAYIQSIIKRGRDIANVRTGNFIYQRIIAKNRIGEVTVGRLIEFNTAE
jgi:hypothetical protein